MRDEPSAPAKPRAPLQDIFKGGPHLMMDGTPHSRALGMRLVDVWLANAIVEVPYAETMVGNRETGVVHGGVVTTILDQVSGLAVFCALESRRAIATLDLRIDYMRPSTPKAPIIAHGHCHKVTKTIAFVRATAHNGDETDPVAGATAAFMIS